MDKSDALEMMDEKIRSGKLQKEAAQEVAKAGGVSVTTINRWYYDARNKGVDLARSSNKTFSEFQEKMLQHIVLGHADCNQPLKVKNIKQYAEILTGKEVSRSTIERFYKKYKEDVQLRDPTPLGKKRSANVSMQVISKFVNTISELYDISSFSGDTVLNYDECRVCVSEDTGKGPKVVVRRGKFKPQVKGGNVNRSSITYLPFASASGHIVFAAIIFKKKAGENLSIVVPHESKYPKKGEPMIRYYHSETGYVNGDLFKVIMEHFVEYWSTIHPSLTCLLFGDNLGFHRRVDIVQYCLKKGVQMAFLPRNTTHWSQPLDNLCFANFKRGMNAAVQEYLEEKHKLDGNLPLSIPDLVLQAQRTGLTQEVISKSFKITGIWPWNPAKVKLLARENHDPSAFEDVKSPKKQVSVPKYVTKAIKKYEFSKEVRAENKRKSLTKVKLPLEVEQGFIAKDVLNYHEEQQREEQKQKKELEERKKAKEREKEESEKQKRIAAEEKKRKRVEREEEVVQKKRRKLELQEMRSCKFKCGKSWRVGNMWTGCENCEHFWICPDCYTIPAAKCKLTKHEKRCT